MLTSRKGAVSRADLLCILAVEGEQALAKMAFALGYEQLISEPSVKSNKNFSEPANTFEQSQPILKPIEGPDKLARACFFYIAERKRKQSNELPDFPETPEWLNQSEALSEDAYPESGTVLLPAYRPLIRWPRLWPFLRAVLGQTTISHQPDIARLIRDVARGESVRKLPLQTQLGWSPKICILLDYQQQTEPFYHDYKRLWGKLKKLHGTLGIDVRILHGEAGLQSQYRNPKDNQVHPWRMPDIDTPLLILSDLGQLSESPQQRQGWERFGRRLRAAGCRPIVLCPVPEPQHDSSLRTLFAIYSWDRNSRLRGKSTFAPPIATSEMKQSPGVETLLALLSVAVVVEPALLRAVRNLLPAAQVNVADEARFWQHPDISSSTQGCCYKTLAAAEKYQNWLKDPGLLASLRIEGITEQNQFKQQLVSLICNHHAYLPQSIRMMEMELCQRLLPGTVEAKIQAEITDWKQAMVTTCYHKANNVSLQTWNSQYIASQPLSTLQNPLMAYLWAFAQKDKLRRGEIIQYPATINKQDVAFLLSGETGTANRECRLFQTGSELRIAENDSNTDLSGSYYADLTLAGELSISTESMLGKTVESSWQWQHSQASFSKGNSKPLVELGQNIRQVSLSNESETLLLKSLPKPHWARQIGRDAEGLWVEFEQHGQSWRVYWPSWGGKLDYDQYGLYYDLNIQGILQRSRWIPPGTFQMGSPNSEKEREDNENQHQVTLTQGYWLADTTCTQALWQAVMGDNPAYFKEDENNPVEQVSWDNVQTFLQELNKLIPGLAARLPTEAQWEYACRAGTSTPFSFGDNITPEQVNYDGDYPYAGGKKGLNREQTVPVKSLPANPWGLYEMHGNIWEWCQDWYADYAQKAVADPIGAESGIHRVLRGGSWIGGGRNSRSASRGALTPDVRHYLGFRFAPGQAFSRPVEPQAW